MFGAGLTLEVYRRSNLNPNLVEVSTASLSAQRFWIDSGVGVSVANGTDCSALDNPQNIDITTVNNPQTQPTFTVYPLHRVPHANTASVGTPTPTPTPLDPANAELYQFAIVNSVYGVGTAHRHPGTDFFRSPVASSPSQGDRVAAVADGTVIGICDPCTSSSTALGPSWVQGVSPTDPPEHAYLVIQHGNTIVIYAHLQPGLRISGINQPVVAGQWIGQIGVNPVEGPHLHFEVRTFGEKPFDPQGPTPPLTFVNGWYYFASPVQSNINQNLLNRVNDPSQQPPDVVSGWQNTSDWSVGDQLTQCFTSSVSPPQGAPSGASTGISVHGYANGTGSDYAAFEWVDNQGNRHVFQVTASGSWQSVCVP
jgi:hypothetical protein